MPARRLDSGRDRGRRLLRYRERAGGDYRNAVGAGAAGSGGSRAEDVDLKPPAFEYVTATSLGEATSALAQHGDEAKVIAGGQSLVPMLNFRLLSPAVLVDVNRIPGLDGVREAEGGGVRIGALTRHHALETSTVISERFPVLAAAMAHVAHLAIRNRGTIGGSLCHADPAAELPALAVLLDARITAARSGGTRIIDAADFFAGALTSALEADEVVTEIDLPALPPGTGWGFHEFARRSGDFGIAGVAATVTRAGEAASQVRIALLGVGEAPCRARDAEALLTGTRFDAAALQAAAASVRQAIDPNDDLHASADFRRHLAGVLTMRALSDAWRRAA
jgi:carbon-monoxide dehydrogenase medium subunit